MNTQNKPKSKDDIQEDEFLLLRESTGHGWRRRLRVVAFIVNGMQRAPVIEVRFYGDRDAHQHGRTVGFNFEEMKIAVENWDKIRDCYFGK